MREREKTVRREIFINDFRGNDDRPRRGRRDNYSYGRGDGYGRGNRTYNYGDKGRGLHVLGGRRDGEGPHLDEGCNTVENTYPNQSVIDSHQQGRYVVRNENQIVRGRNHIFSPSPIRSIAPLFPVCIWVQRR